MHPIVLRRGTQGTTPARVLEQVRARGPITRDQVVAATGLSMATVTRTCSALRDAGMLAERPDSVVPGQVGRPSSLLSLDATRYASLGVHLGRRVVTVALGGLDGRVLAAQTLPHEVGGRALLSQIAQVGAEMLSAHPDRIPLNCGLVAPWRDLEIEPESTALSLQDELGLDVVSADHIAAIAAAEYLPRRDEFEGVTAYVYARDTVGFAVAVEHGSNSQISRVGMLAHFPAGTDVPCACGRRGCLEASASDHAVARRAQEQGLIERPSIEDLHAAAAEGPGPARDLVRERARRLGEAVAHVRDMIDPDRMVLVGQGFTGSELAVPVVLEAMRATMALPDLKVHVTRMGARVQATAAVAIGLNAVYDAPLAHVPRSLAAVRGRRPA